MIIYFGQPWNAQARRGIKVDTPVGQPCERCSEKFTADSTGVVYAADGERGRVLVHVECDALGFIGHDFGVCSCTGYDTTSHAAALELWRRLGEKRPR